MHFQNFGVLLAMKIVRCFRKLLRERSLIQHKKRIRSVIYSHGQ
jgi:hypothetical protein